MLVGSWFPDERSEPLGVGALSPGDWTAGEFLTQGNISEKSHEGFPAYIPRPGTTQLSAAPSTGCLTWKQQTGKDTNPVISIKASPGNPKMHTSQPYPSEAKIKKPPSPRRT